MASHVSAQIANPTEAYIKKRFRSPLSTGTACSASPLFLLSKANIQTSETIKQIAEIITIAKSTGAGKFSTPNLVSVNMSALLKQCAIIVGNTLPDRTAISAYAAPQQN